MTSVYAFVGWISTIVIFAVLLCWVFVPGDILHNFGITYYPNRYYAVAIPAYILTTSILIGMSYVGLNMFKTFEPEDLRTVEDRHSRIITTYGLNRVSSLKDSAEVPEIGDIDPADVSILLMNTSRKRRKKQ